MSSLCAHRIRFWRLSCCVFRRLGDSETERLYSEHVNHVRWCAPSTSTSFQWNLSWYHVPRRTLVSTDHRCAGGMPTVILSDLNSRGLLHKSSCRSLHYYVVHPVGGRYTNCCHDPSVRLSVQCLSITGKQTRNSSGDEIANVNFLYDDIVHAVKYNRFLHKFRHRSFSATQVYQIQ